VETFFRAIIEGLLNGGIYALIALGVVMVYKASGVFNIAYGEIMMLLAYMTTSLAANLPSIWIALPVILLVGAASGLLFDRVLMRPLVGQPMMIPFMVCLLLGIFLSGAVILGWEGLPKTMPDLFPAGRISIGNISIDSILVWCFVAALTLFGIFVLFFRFSNVGLAMRAVSEDNVTSQSIGINVKKIYALAWAIGCTTAAISGVLASSVFVVDPSIGQFVIMRALPILLLGGLESIPGALVGALTIGIAETLSATYVENHISGFRDVLPFVLMVVILMLRPQGLFGQKRIDRI
jgi:branched-chain amino acid transport system permease protein